MKNNSELLFLQSNRCGTLYYHNVYNYYDEPLIFSAMNEYEQLFFCYSLGCDDSDDRWIIIPTSSEKLNELEQKDISVVKMIKQSSTSKVLLVKINLDNNNINEEFVLSKKLTYKMPKDDYYIRENINYDGKRKYSHKIRIAKVNEKDIISEILNQASDVFTEFCRHYLEKHNLSVKFFPQDAVKGSFVYRIKTTTKQLDEFNSIGYQLLQEITTPKCFMSAINDKKIDLRIVRKLFEIIAVNDLVIQFIDENSTNNILNLSAEYAKRMIPEIDDKLGIYLDSTMVPQADNLMRIKKYLSIVDNQRVVTAEELGVHHRQVSYYRDACRMLSLIHDYSILTPLGQKMNSLNSEVEFIELIKRQFEETDCGALWMLNQKVSSIVEINEESATEFLIENCNGLSESTSRRRAQTLKSWVKKFKEFS